MRARPYLRDTPAWEALVAQAVALVPDQPPRLRYDLQPIAGAGRQIARAHAHTVAARLRHATEDAMLILEATSDLKRFDDLRAAAAARVAREALTEVLALTRHEDPPDDDGESPGRHLRPVP